MQQRKTRSLYGDLIRDALLHEQPWLKSEDLPEFKRFYVNNDLIEAIHNNGNHLIVGRRGTGKTHLLGSFVEFIRDDCPDEMAIMVSILESFPKTPPSLILETEEFASKKAASFMFEGFLKVLFKRFLDRATERLEVVSIRKTKADAKLFGKQVNDLLTNLMEAIELGDSYQISKKNFFTKEKTSSEGVGLNGSAEAQIDKFIPKLNAAISIEGGKNNKGIIKTKTEIESLLSVNLFQVRELFIELIDVLEIEVLHILIDEWMELDKKDPSGVQPLFAQYLKTTFFNDKRFSIKIATIWHQTNLYDQDEVDRSKGIQLRHDITRSVDLDTAFLTSDEDVLSFVKNALFKRLEYACKEIASLKDRDGEVSDLFVTELFDNFENFKVFVTASHGIPRDMMLLFQICSSKIKRNFNKNCICHDLINTTSQNLYNSDKRKNIDPSSTPQRLLQLINHYMENTGRRIFIVENTQVKKSRSLRKLVDEEMIHQVPSAVTPRIVRDTHKVFQIDYGNFIDWVKTRKHHLTHIINDKVLPSFPTNFDQTYQTYFLDIELAIKDRVFCQCGHIFSSHDPVYLKASICPKCAIDLHTDGIPRDHVSESRHRSLHGIQ
ncbi:hypothetical protein MGMO_188c00030 [Methyloglobulus morosus KoM1]|uniref:Uncharacterized protein n=1 Tax=Methyloglobulus morosus KoM1 TaxID=1116472 RepID=V5BFE2_9GAMM|nr:hypothetical protein [Methyloglobulus morosus]ESS66474.1 hypothetical protein MGMO_188c00030 [Methyloglobulus morosus KoM1]